MKVDVAYCQFIIFFQYSKDRRIFVTKIFETDIDLR